MSRSPRQTNKSRRPTIIDVAAAAGVSRTQASDALNGRGRVEASTRERVIAAARQLGYRANISARNLRAAKTGVLAMLLPELGRAAVDNEAFGLEIYGRTTVAAASAAFAHGYALTFVPSHDQLTWLRQIAYDGVVVTDPDSGDTRMDLLDELEIPYVSIERDVARESDFYVASATDVTSRRLFDHLEQRGARRIALLRPPADWAWIVETTEALRAWSAERGRDALVVPVSLNQLEGASYETSMQLLTADDPPDAIFGLADRSALGVLRAAGELGIDVPGELMIAAGVDTHANQVVQPTLTALEINPERTARAAVDMLVQRLAGEAVSGPLTIPGTVVERASTAR